MGHRLPPSTGNAERDAHAADLYRTWAASSSRRRPSVGWWLLAGVLMAAVPFLLEALA